MRSSSPAGTIRRRDRQGTKQHGRHITAQRGRCCSVGKVDAGSLRLTGGGWVRLTALLLCGKCCEYTRVHVPREREGAQCQRSLPLQKNPGDTGNHCGWAPGGRRGRADYDFISTKCSLRQSQGPGRLGTLKKINFSSVHGRPSPKKTTQLGSHRNRHNSRTWQPAAPQPLRC